MELGRMHMIEVSKSTLDALKIIALIALILLCTQIVKATIARVPTGKRENDRWERQAADMKKKPPVDKADSESVKKYWKDVAAELDKDFPASERTSSKKSPDRKGKNLRNAVNDKNIKIRKKPDLVPVVVLKDSSSNLEDKKKNPNGKNKKRQK